MRLCSQKGQSLEKPPGVFDSPEELRTYEKMWHRDVYDCSMRGIKDRVCGDYTKIEYIIDVVFCTLCVYYTYSTYLCTYVRMYCMYIRCTLYPTSTARGLTVNVLVFLS